MKTSYVFQNVDGIKKWNVISIKYDKKKERKKRRGSSHRGISQAVFDPPNWQSKKLVKKKKKGIGDRGEPETLELESS